MYVPLVAVTKLCRMNRSRDQPVIWTKTFFMFHLSSSKFPTLEVLSIIRNDYWSLVLQTWRAFLILVVRWGVTGSPVWRVNMREIKRKQGGILRQTRSVLWPWGFFSFLGPFLPWLSYSKSETESRTGVLLKILYCLHDLEQCAHLTFYLVLSYLTAESHIDIVVKTHIILTVRHLTCFFVYLFIHLFLANCDSTLVF